MPLGLATMSVCFGEPDFSNGRNSFGSLHIALEKDYLRGPTPRDHAKNAIFQGACIFGIGVLATLATSYFLGVVWFITPIIAIVGAFRFLYGLLSYFLGWR